MSVNNFITNYINNIDKIHMIYVFNIVDSIFGTDNKIKNIIFFEPNIECEYKLKIKKK